MVGRGRSRNRGRWGELLLRNALMRRARARAGSDGGSRLGPFAGPPICGRDPRRGRLAIAVKGGERRQFWGGTSQVPLRLLRAEVRFSAFREVLADLTPESLLSLNSSNYETQHLQLRA